MRIDNFSDNSRLQRQTAFALSAVLLSLPDVASAQTTDGIVTFTFDDALRSQFELALPIAKELGIEGTIFVITGEADDATEVIAQAEAEAEEEANPDEGADTVEEARQGLWYMTWDEIRAFYAAGWEIGSHTNSHAHLTEHPDERVTDEIATGRGRITAEIGTDPVSIAPPYGDYDERTLELALDQHFYHLLAYGEENGGQNPISHTDPGHIDRYPVTIWTPPDMVCGEMVNAALDHTWLVLLFHGFTEEEPNDYEVGADSLRAIMECARVLEDHDLIRVATVADAMGLVAEAAAENGDGAEAGEDAVAPEPME